MKCGEARVTDPPLVPSWQHRGWKVLILIIMCLTVLLQVMAQSARHTNNDSTTSRISAEISRLKGVLAALKLSAAEEESFSSLLSRSERAAQAGHIFLSLHILQYA